jgi:hypothetical protein
MGDIAFLSADWVARQRDLGADLPERPGLSARVQVTVTDRGGRRTEAVYWLAWEDGRAVDGGTGTDPEAGVQLTAPAAVVRELAGGAVDASSAYMQGRLKTAGDQAALLRFLQLTATPEYDAAVRALAADTDLA